MSTTQRQMRKGTTAEHATFTGALAEVTVDTTKKTLVVHDGVTAGGFPVARASDIPTVPTPPSDMVGATATVNGTHGLVPAPVAGQQNFYLGGDGAFHTLKINVINETTATRTLTTGDLDSYIRFTYTGAKSFTIVNDSTVATPTGTVVSGISANGQLTIVAGSGVTINSNKTLKLINENYVAFSLMKVGANTWDLTGAVSD